MDWTKIPVDLLQTRKTDKEIIAIVKYQMLWAMLERKPDDDVALRYMTPKQLQQARYYASSIEQQVRIDISNTKQKRNRDKIYYMKKQQVKKNSVVLTDTLTDTLTGGLTASTDKIREDKIYIISSDKSSDIIVKINEILTRYGLAKIRDLTDERKRKLRERCNSVGGFDNFLNEIDIALSDSSFLRGDNSNGWQADFDFFLQKSSWQKVLEGKYKDKHKTIEQTPDAFEGFTQAIGEFKRRTAQ